MGRNPIRSKLVLDAEARSKLESIAKSRTEGQARIERAKVLLALQDRRRVCFIDVFFLLSVFIQILSVQPLTKPQS